MKPCKHGHIDGALHKPCYQCRCEYYEKQLKELTPLKIEKQVVDIVALANVVTQLRTDVEKGFGGIDRDVMLLIAKTIEQAMGAPIMMPTRVSAIVAADVLFPGNPSARHGFNAGVAWIIKQWPNLPQLYAQAIQHHDE